MAVKSESFSVLLDPLMHLYKYIVRAQKKRLQGTNKKYKYKIFQKFEIKNPKIIRARLTKNLIFME